MGLFWDLMQQDEIDSQKEQSESLEERVAILEKELEKTRKLLMDTLHVLEKHVGVDIDKNGKIG
jgi:hypothetical protein